MTKKAQAIPKGYHTVTPSIFVAGAAKAIHFYKEALGAEEVMRFPGPDGTIMHAEIRIGDSTIMLGDEMPDQGGKSPKSYGGTPVSFLTLLFGALGSRAKASIFDRTRLAIAGSMRLSVLTASAA